MATYTSRQFNRDVSGAKRAAAVGPVFITHRGTTTHVLITIQEYRRLTEGKKSVGHIMGTDSEPSEAFDRIVDEIPEKPRRETPRSPNLD